MIEREVRVWACVERMSGLVVGSERKAETLACSEAQSASRAALERRSLAECEFSGSAEGEGDEGVEVARGEARGEERGEGAMTGGRVLVLLVRGREKAGATWPRLRRVRGFGGVISAATSCVGSVALFPGAEASREQAANWRLAMCFCADQSLRYIHVPVYHAA